MWAQRLAAYHSRHLGSIQVWLLNNRFYFSVDGAVQVGSVAHKRFIQTLDSVDRYCSHPESALILGYGGGNFATELRHRYPNIHITGIDIDPTIVKLGETYFHQTPLAHTKVFIADAFTWIKRNVKRFDLIFIDVYQGFTIPQKTTSKVFLNQVNKALTPKGVLSINFFNQAESIDQLDRLTTNLRSIFSVVNQETMLGNHVFFITP